jgi:hypothetical protein
VPTGNSATSWSWLNKSTLVMCLVTAEATWVSLLASASINASPGTHVHLPFLALVLPGLASVLVAGATSTIRSRWARWAVLAVIVLVGATLSAGLISQLNSAPLWRVAFLPWTVNGHNAMVAAASAWLLAGLGWGRGVWLGVRPPTFGHVAWSFLLGAAAFVGLFIGHADRHAVQLRAVTGSAGWLFFVWFPFISAVIALVRQRDLEASVMHRTGSRPGGAWLAILAVPMLGIAVIALLLALVVGPGAPIVARGVAHGAAAAGHGIAAAIKWVLGLLPESHGHSGAVRTVAPKLPTVPVGGATGAAHSGSIPVYVLIALYLVLAVVAILLLRLLLRSLLSMRRDPAPPDETVTEDSDSVFSWSHLLDQFRAFLRSIWRRLFGRFRRRADTVVAQRVSDDERAGALEAETVRRAYRRMLANARANGRGRRRNETARELQVRLGVGLAPEGQAALGTLTALYDVARYGETDHDPATAARASARADEVGSAVTDAAEQARERARAASAVAIAATGGASTTTRRDSMLRGRWRRR